MAAIATPTRQRLSKGSRRGRRLKLFRKTTFLVNDGGGGGQAYGSEHDEETNRKSSYAHPQPMSAPSPSDDNSKLRIVQFSQETALSKSIRRKAKSEGKTMLHDYLDS